MTVDWVTEVDSSMGLSPVTTHLHPAHIAHQPPSPNHPIAIPVAMSLPHIAQINPHRLIRVPQMEMDTSTHPILSAQAVVKLTSPSHPVTPCHGNLAPVASIHSFPLHHAFNSFISQVISLSFCFPRQLFSCYSVS